MSEASLNNAYSLDNQSTLKYNYQKIAIINLKHHSLTLFVFFGPPQFILLCYHDSRLVTSDILSSRPGYLQVHFRTKQCMLQRQRDSERGCRSDELRQLPAGLWQHLAGDRWVGP